jgi:hypothetical protein
VNTRELKELALSDDKALISLVKRWVQSGESDPVSELFERSRSKALLLRFHGLQIIVALIVWHLVPLMGSPIKSFWAWCPGGSQLALSFWAFILAFPAWYFPLRKYKPDLYMFKKLEERERRLKRYNAFLRSVSLLEMKFGQVNQKELKWTNAEELASAAERMFFYRAIRIIRLQDVPWRAKEAQMFRDSFVADLKELAFLAPISLKLDYYFSAERIEQFKKQEDARDFKDFDFILSPRFKLVRLA